MRYIYQGVAKDGNGKVIPSATVSVYLAGTTTPADVYAASSGGAAVNSVTCGTDGHFLFWVDNGSYSPFQNFKIIISVANFIAKPFDNIVMLPELNRDYYYPDYNAADQGVAGDSNTINYYVDLAAGDNATIVLRHNSGSATTTYTLTTSETIPANITLKVERGAVIGGAGTLAINGSLDAGNYQIFGTNISVVFGNGSINDIQVAWWYASGDFAVAINAAVTASSNQSTVTVTPGAQIDIDTTVTIDTACHVNFNKRLLNYTGSGTAVAVSSTAATYENLAITTSLDQSNASLIGLLETEGRRVTRHITSIKNFTVGWKINSTTSGGISHNTYFLDHNIGSAKFGLVINSADPGFTTAIDFHGFEAYGVAGPTAGSIGIQIDSIYIAGSLQFYSPTIQTFAVGVSDNSDNVTGNNYYSPYMEGNTKHFETGANCDYIFIWGGHALSPSTLLQEDDIGNTNGNKVVLGARQRENFIFPQRGLFEGKTDGFANLLKNGHFEHWADATTCNNWGVLGREGTIVKTGTYSAKVDATASTNYGTQTLDAWTLSYLKGKYVTVSGWVYSTVAGKGHIGINDGVSTTYTGTPAAADTWEFKTHTKLIDASATTIQVSIRNTSSSIGYFDNVIMTVGRNVPVFTPRPLSDIDFINGSATWDPGSLADGVGETKSISVPGAALGDFVSVSAPYDLQDMTATGYVQATDTVEIRLQNESGGTLDVASGTWKVRVWKQ